MGHLGFGSIQLIFQLPLLVVVVAGFALIPGRRARIGARRAGLATAGLALLTADTAIGLAWATASQLLLTQGNLTGQTFPVLATTIGFFLTMLSAISIALLLAAALTPPPTK